MGVRSELVVPSREAVGSALERWVICLRVLLVPLYGAGCRGGGVAWWICLGEGLELGRARSRGCLLGDLQETHMIKSKGKICGFAKLAVR